MTSTCTATETPATTIVDRSCETTAAGIPWLQFHGHRAAIRRRWPNTMALPIVTSPFQSVTADHVRPESLLDVGATSRVWETPARERWPGIDYRSLDIDRTQPHDYHDFAELDRSFDLVSCLEVLEHVSPRVGLQIINDCMRACRPGGHVLVSVPNVLTPGVQLEFTHETAFACMDVGGLLSWVGLEVRSAARFWSSPSRRRLWIHRYALGPLHRAMRVDYCQSIVMLARKVSR